MIIVSADLNTGKPILHGESLADEILEAFLVSTALPPWVMPAKNRDWYLMDGGVVSNLPIEPALRAGATEIIALDLMDTRELFTEHNGIGFFLDRLTFAVEKRQADLEMELAEGRGIPITYLGLTGKELIPFWDFHHTDELIARGYEIAKRATPALPGTARRGQDRCASGASAEKYSDKLIQTIQV